MSEYCDLGIENLRNATIEYAFEDYIKALMGRRVNRNPPEFTITEIEWWAINGDFRILCDEIVDGRKAIMAARERAIDRLEEEIKNLKKKIEKKEKKISKPETTEENKKELLKDIENMQHKIVHDESIIRKIKSMKPV